MKVANSAHRLAGRAFLHVATCNFQFSIFNLLLAFAFLSLPAHALHFPDTADLARDYHVSARASGHPSDYFRKVDGDSNSVHIEWGKAGMAEVRYEQGGEFNSDSFSVLTAEYGNGAAWHETPGNTDAAVRKAYPGLQQEWLLKGYGNERGWLASGVNRGRYFLVFRALPPTAAAVAAGPLRLNRSVFAFLDTSSQWLHVKCPGEPAKAAASPSGKSKAEKSKPEKSAGAVCFSPDEDSHTLLRIDRKKPLSLQAWIDEPESGSLADVKKAFESVPDASQADYAKDLSQMLQGEGQGFLVKLAQKLPALFNWPSWQLQDFRGGKIPDSELLPIVRRQQDAGEFLTALRFQDAGLKLTVNLYYQGRYHLIAEEENGGASAGK